MCRWKLGSRQQAPEKHEKYVTGKKNKKSVVPLLFQSSRHKKKKMDWPAYWHFSSLFATSGSGLSRASVSLNGAIKGEGNVLVFECPLGSCGGCWGHIRTKKEDAAESVFSLFSTLALSSATHSRFHRFLCYPMLQCASPLQEVVSSYQGDHRWNHRALHVPPYRLRHPNQDLESQCQAARPSSHQPDLIAF